VEGAARLPAEARSGAPSRGSTAEAQQQQQQQQQPLPLLPSRPCRMAAQLVHPALLLLAAQQHGAHLDGCLQPTV
jgi:hypothetical protein